MMEKKRGTSSILIEARGSIFKTNFDLKTRVFGRLMDQYNYIEAYYVHILMAMRNKKSKRYACRSRI